MALSDDPEVMACVRDPHKSTRQVERETGMARSYVARLRRKFAAEEGWQRAETPSAPRAGADTPGDRSEESSDGSRVLEGIRDRAVTMDDARAWIASTGDDPDDFHLSIRSIAYGPGLWSNRMSATPKRGRAKVTWTPVVQATPVLIALDAPEPRAPRDHKIAMKAADTQFGFRQTPAGLEPFHDDAAINVFLAAVRDVRPDKVTILGDLIDLPQQGRFEQEAGFALTMQASIDATYRFLARLRAAAPDADLVVVEGNHDKRLLVSIQTNAAAAFGLKRADTAELPVMSLPFLLRLEELGIRYMDAYPAAADWDTPTTRNIHGTRANSKGSTTSQYIHELPHINTWVGHTHRAEMTFRTVVGPGGEPIERYSANPGCLCRIDGAVPSVHGAIHHDGSSARVAEDWQQGFGILRYTDDEEWPQIVRIKDGRAMFDGRLYAA